MVAITTLWCYLPLIRNILSYLVTLVKTGVKNQKERTLAFINRRSVQITPELRALVKKIWDSSGLSQRVICALCPGDLISQPIFARVINGDRHTIMVDHLGALLVGLRLVVGQRVIPLTAEEEELLGLEDSPRLLVGIRDPALEAILSAYGVGLMAHFDITKESIAGLARILEAYATGMKK